MPPEPPVPSTPSGSWSRVAREVEARLGPSCRPWLAAAAPEPGPEGVLALRVPSAFVRDALRARCGSALLDAARAAGFTRVDVQLPSPRGGGPSLAAFRVSAGSQLAYAAVASLARRLRPEIHPLVLWGPAGCGKSHLLAALAAASRARGVSPLVSTTAPRLASRLALSARDGRLPAFRASLRACRMLLLDEGERLAGKVKTQSELALALDALRDGGGVAVLAFRVAPAHLQALSAPLRSRLLGGLVCEMENNT